VTTHREDRTTNADVEGSATVTEAARADVDEHAARAPERGRTARPPRIVIVGGGYGGAYCAHALERRLKSRLVRPARLRPGDQPPPRRDDAVEVVLFDRRNYFIFYPLLVEAGTGGLEPRHAVVSIRSFLKRAGFIMGDVIDVDFHQQTVTYRLGGEPGQSETMAWDHLVLAPGSVTMMPDIPGLKEHALTVKGLGDAVALRDRAIHMLEVADAIDDPAERRRLLQFVVVGGSFTGVEVAGEFDAFLKRVAKRYPNLSPDDCCVNVIELTDRILPQVSQPLADYAKEKLRARGVNVLLEESVSEVAADHVVLKSGGRIETRTTIWCAGIAPPPLFAKLDLPKDDKGYVLCERDLRVEERENVWAVGDGAVNIDAEGNPYPATAQHAVREGEHLAKNLAAVVDDRAATPFDYSTQGTLAALGCRTGVAEVMGFKLSGFPAWWLWRTVYLLKMPGLGRKVRVALDWTLDLLFKRDDVQLGVHRTAVGTKR